MKLARIVVRRVRPNLTQAQRTWCNLLNAALDRKEVLTGTRRFPSSADITFGDYVRSLLLGLDELLLEPLRLHEVLTVCLSDWLSILKKVRFDLEAEGRREHARFTCGSMNFSLQSALRMWRSRRHPELNSYPWSRPGGSNIKIVGFMYGLASSDRKLWFSCPYDEWSGDFWKLVEEGPELRIPGAWIDGDEEEQALKRAETGDSKSLATSQRKRRRYLRMLGWNDKDARINLGPRWKWMIDINRYIKRGWEGEHYVFWPRVDVGESQELDWWRNRVDWNGQAKIVDDCWTTEDDGMGGEKFVWLLSDTLE